MNNKCRTLAPWEEIGYFQSPNVFQTTISAPNVWFQLVPPNPNRVVLLLSTAPSTGAVALSPRNDVPTGRGIQLTSTTTYFVLTEAEHGNLCTSAWYVSGTSGNNGFAIEGILREFPECQT